MRALTVIFIALIALLQYPLWLGKGSWLRVWNVSHQIEDEKKLNAQYKERNDALRAEVRDLKQGQSAIEERARSELGMIKNDEIFIQVVTQADAPKDAPTVTAPAAQASGTAAKP